MKLNLISSIIFTFAMDLEQVAAETKYKKLCRRCQQFSPEDSLEIYFQILLFRLHLRI